MNKNLLQTIHLQQKASDPQNSAWVFASAGSGKTKILTDRVLRLLLEDVAPNKILCLTFTKVAAAEMQHRINAELSKWVLCDDEELQQKLHNLTGHKPNNFEIKKARTLLVKILDDEGKIKIQTIHSFCQTIIKICPFEAGVSPAFEVIEKERETLLLEQAKKNILNLALKNVELGELIKRISTQLNEDSFSQLIGKMLAHKEQLNLLQHEFFGIDNLIDEIFKKFSLSKNQNEHEIFAEFLSKLEQEKILKILPSLEQSKSKTNQEIATKIKKFLRNPEINNFETYKSAFFTQENSIRKIYGEAGENPELLNFISEECQKILHFLEKINSLKIANNTATLLKILAAILENYHNLKKQNALLDYNDLIIETNKLLSNPDYMDWVKMKMDGSFDHILIDESQDTNHRQWDIVKSLSEDFFSGESSAQNNRSIFIVGDEKQSIYSFQGADPNISQDIFDFFQTRLGENLKKIELNNSFRSAHKILQAVDEVFADKDRAKAISKIAAFANHQAIRQEIGKVEIWQQIPKTEITKKEKSFEWQFAFNQEKEPAAEEILAEFIAKKIKSRVENSDSEKSANYGDFMILLRTRTNGFDQALVKTFHQYKIPFTSVSNVKFSDSLLVQDILSAAKFVTLPDDDLNLACLLKSPIFEINEEDLLEICLKKNHDNSSIYQALSQLPKFSSAKNYLDELIARSKILNCFEFFYFLLSDKNQQKIISYFGLENIALIENFLLIAANFCEKFSPHLQIFLEFVAKIDPTISLAQESENRVRITTIHSSKGLQAPIVIIPDCSYNFYQLPNSKEEIIWTDFGKSEIPLWCRKKSEENHIVAKQRQHKIKQAEEEYLRLLYVAMTRAENELYIGGFGNSSDPKSWYEIIKNSVSGADFISLEEIKNELAELAKIDDQHQLQKQEEEEKLPDDCKYFLAANNENFINQIDKSQIKGRLIHKILEVIGLNFQEDKSWLIQVAEGLINNEQFLDLKTKKQIHDEIWQFINSSHFQEIFSGNVQCEVEVSGEISGKKFLGRIDLLIEKENEVLIIDYKSDKTLPDNIPQEYLQQIQNYHQLIKNLYPSKQINCAIFWIEFMKLDKIKLS